MGRFTYFIYSYWTHIFAKMCINAKLVNICPATMSFSYSLFDKREGFFAHMYFFVLFRIISSVALVAYGMPISPHCTSCCFLICRKQLFIVSIHSGQSVVPLRVIKLIMCCINNKEKYVNYNGLSTKTITTWTSMIQNTVIQYTQSYRHTISLATKIIFNGVPLFMEVLLV